MNESIFYETEIPPIEIFKKMQQNIYDNYYYNYFFKMNKEYASMRASLFAIIHKVCEKMGFRSQTFFLCVQYLDIIFSKKQNNIPFSKYNIIGLACLCLSAKYCENDPIVPHLQYFIRVYNNLVRGGWKNSLYKSDLLYFEVVAVKLLNYKLNYNTIYDFDSFFWGHGIVKIEQLTDINYNGYSRTYSIKKIIEKIYKKSREYLDIVINNWKICTKYNPLMLSIFIMKKSVEEVLLNEKRFSDKDNKFKERFIRKNSLCYQEIMYDFYKIDYEPDIQYKEIIKDDEINKIFKNNEVRNLSPALECLNNQEIKFKEKINEKENKENNNNMANNINKKSNIISKFEGNIYSTKTHNSTTQNFNKRNYNLNTNKIINKLNINNKNKENNENKDKDSKNILNDFKDKKEINIIDIQNLKIKPKIISKKNNIIEDIISSNKKNIIEEKNENIDDDLNKNLNIDELKSLKSIDAQPKISKYHAFINSNNSRNNNNNIYSSNTHHNLNTDKSNNNILNESSISSIRQRYKKATSNVYYQKLTSNNNKYKINIHLSNNYDDNANRSVENNTISNSLSINNIEANGKLIFQKKIENLKTLPLETETSISNKPNLNNYTQTQVDRYITNGRRRVIRSKNLSNISNNSIVANNSCQIEEEKLISKPYFKKYAHQINENENNNNNINNNINSTNQNPNNTVNNNGNYFYSNSNNKLNNCHGRIRLKKNIANNNNLVESENNTNNTSTLNINNTGSTNNKTINNNNEISPVGTFGSRYRRKNYPYKMNNCNDNSAVKVSSVINENAGNFDNECKEKNETETKDNKFNLTSSSSFYPRNINNKINDVNDLKSIDRKLPKKRISYLLAKKSEDLSNKLKEVNNTNYINTNNDLNTYEEQKNDNKIIEEENKEKEKDEENNEKKIMSKTGESWMSSRLGINKYSSIRKRYRNMKIENDCKNNNNIISNNPISNKEKEVEKNNKDTIDNNEISSNNKRYYENYKNKTIENQIRSKKVNLKIDSDNDNSPIDNHVNNENKLEEPQSTFLKFINKTKALFGRKSQEKKTEVTQAQEVNDNNSIHNNYLYKRRVYYNQNNINNNKINNNNKVINNKTYDEKEPKAKNNYYRARTNKEDTNNQPSKNTIVINNNININIGEKINSNINANNIRMKYKMKRNDTGFFDKNNNNDKNNTVNNTIINNTSNKINDIKKENNDTTLNSLLRKIPFYKKYTGNNISNIVSNNIDNNINNNTINNYNRNNNAVVNGSRIRRNLFGEN